VRLSYVLVYDHDSSEIVMREDLPEKHNGLNHTPSAWGTQSRSSHSICRAFGTTMSSGTLYSAGPMYGRASASIFFVTGAGDALMMSTAEGAILCIL